MTPDIGTDTENQSSMAPPDFEIDLDRGAVALVGVPPPLMLER
jgi:hypothetical protein